MPMPMPMFSERASVVMVIADRQAQVVQGTEQEQGHAPTASREPALPVTLLTCCSTILYESQGVTNISLRLSLELLDSPSAILSNRTLVVNYRVTRKTNVF